MLQPEKCPKCGQLVSPKSLHARVCTRQHEHKVIVDEVACDDRLRKMLIKGFKRFVRKD